MFGKHVVRSFMENIDNFGNTTTEANFLNVQSTLQRATSDS